MSAGSNNLKSNQRQLDADGCEVGVSRQALDETLAQYDDMLDALKTALRMVEKEFPNGQAAIDIRAAIAKATA